MGQAMLLELMFGNLIDNALRYTQVGGEVAVVVSQVGNRIRVDVRDNGPGIPTAALSRLCERFFRVNPQQGGWRGPWHGHRFAHRPASRSGSRHPQPA